MLLLYYVKKGERSKVYEFSLPINYSEGKVREVEKRKQQ